MTDTTTEALAELAAPFPPEHVGKLSRITCPACSKKQCQEHQRKRCDECGSYISERHIHLDYVGHADVTRRLLETDPTWQWEPLAFDENGLPLLDTDDRGHPVGMWIRLTVLGVTRLGYGSCPSNQTDAVKVLIGDALRNAAMRFGVALDLWAKGDRADPSTENAVDAAGTAVRRRPAAPRTEPVTDPEWLTRMENALTAATSLQELETTANTIKAADQAGQVSRVHGEHLFHLYQQRQSELTGQGAS
jgi:hypothetical protein